MHPLRAAAHGGRTLVAANTSASGLASSDEADTCTNSLSRAQRPELKHGGGARTLCESLRRDHVLSYGLHTAAALRLARCKAYNMVRASSLESTQSVREHREAAATAATAVAAVAATGIRKPAADCKFLVTEPRGQLHVRGWRGARLLHRRRITTTRHIHPPHLPSACYHLIHHRTVNHCQAVRLELLDEKAALHQERVMKDQAATQPCSRLQAAALRPRTSARSAPLFVLYSPPFLRPLRRRPFCCSGL